MNAPLPQQHDDERLFAEKAQKFEEADASFRNLVESLTEYRGAILRAAECGVVVATNMEKFFAVHDRPHNEVAAKFLEAQKSIRSKWLSDAEKIFDAEVVAPIKSCVDEIPKVRKFIKDRSTALTDMQKRQKRLQAERKRNGSRFNNKQRKCKEVSDQYTMFNDEVIKRFNYIERNMGTFVTPPLRSLVSLMSEVSKATVESLGDVVKIVAEAPLITKDLSPGPPMTLQDSTGGVVDIETWDESFEVKDDGADDGADTEHDTEDGDFDSVVATSASSQMKRSTMRVRSAEVITGRPSCSVAGLELPFDTSLMTSPRRGRSASSAPAESLSAFTGSLLPSFVTNPVKGQRESGAGPGSSSGHASQSDFQAMIAANGFSAASSTSTDNMTDRVTAHSQMHAGLRQRRDVDGKGSTDTVYSGESLGRNEVLIRLVAMYDFAPRESNELELHKGNVIEVISKNESGWWCGQSGRSRGYFPHNYTRQLTEKEEYDYLVEKERSRKRRGHRRLESTDSRRSGQASTHTQSSVPVI